jgi:hypothetical protein
MAPETPSTKFPRNIKGAESDYGGSNVDGVLLEAASQVQLEAADDGGTDYGSDFDSEGDEEVTRILAELDSVRVVTEPLEEVEVENASGRKCLVYIPNFSSPGSSGRTRTTSFHVAREIAENELAVEEEILVNIDIPELSSRTSQASAILVE